MTLQNKHYIDSLPTFSKKHSQIAKGVAILMMLYHHLYVVPERISAEYFSIFDTVLPNSQITIATFCKLCVGIYIFLSGFGLYHQYKSKSLLEMYKSVLLRIVRFMTSFVVIYLLFVPLGYFTGHFPWNMRAFLRGAIGLNLGNFNNTWWFVNAYLLLLVISPPLVYCFTNKHWFRRLLSLGIIIALYMAGQIYMYFLGTNVLINNFYFYLEEYTILLPMVVGIFCARFNIYGLICGIFTKIHNQTWRKICLLMFSSLALAASVVFRVCTTRSIVDMRFDFVIAPMFVFSVSTLICELHMDRFFVYCGNHSTNMWLTHAFLCYTYCQQLVFLPYYSELVFVWFIILSVIVSYGVNLVLIPLDNKLFSRNHQWSYKGFRCWPITRKE